MSWFDEAHRHALASKGVKSVSIEFVAPRPTQQPLKEAEIRVKEDGKERNMKLAFYKTGDYKYTVYVDETCGDEHKHFSINVETTKELDDVIKDLQAMEEKKGGGLFD